MGTVFSNLREKIVVTEHALKRWQERIDKDSNRNDIAHLAREAVLYGKMEECEDGKEKLIYRGICFVTNAPTPMRRHVLTVYRKK